MAYGKFRRSRYSKYRRFRYSRLVRNRGAIAQAGQINTLSKRITGLARKLRPDTLIYKSDVYQNTFTYNTGGAPNGKLYKSWALTADEWTDADNVTLQIPNGDIRKLYNFRVFGNIVYSDNFTASSLGNARSGRLRLVVYQQKASATNASLPFNWSDPSSNPSGYALNDTAPLLDGVTATYKILLDKVYTLSDQRPVIKFDLNFRSLLPLRASQTDSNDQGTIYVAMIHSGLSYVAQGFQNQLVVSWQAKLALPEP